MCHPLIPGQLGSILAMLFLQVFFHLLGLEQFEPHSVNHNKPELVCIWLEFLMFVVHVQHVKSRGKKRVEFCTSLGLKRVAQVTNGCGIGINIWVYLEMNPKGVFRNYLLW